MNYQINSSGKPRFANRVGWAKTHLKKSGLITYPQRGHLQITQRGLDVLEEKPQKIDMEFLKRFPEYIEFRQGNQKEEETLDDRDED